LAKGWAKASGVSTDRLEFWRTLRKPADIDDLIDGVARVLGRAREVS